MATKPSRLPTNTRLLASVAGLLLAVGVSTGSHDAAYALAPRGTAERAVANDNRTPAGRLSNGVLTLRLEAREAMWHPEGPTGPGIPVYAFAEAGRPAAVPGPMIRVPEGTDMRITLVNTLTKPLRLHGIHHHERDADSVVIAPGASEELRLRADVPGTYLYWARTESFPTPARMPGRIDAGLAGAFIIDSAGARPDRERVLFISSWSDTLSGRGTKSDQADLVLRREMILKDKWLTVTVNGLAWPHNERLSYTVGDTVRWRVINASGYPHPMHLHGFYFDVTARGDWRRDTTYAPHQIRAAVTEWMVPGTTMRMTWVPTRPGNWLFHCHLVTHITETMRLGAPRAGASHDHAERGMAGLVTGIRVAPVRPETPVRHETARRSLRLFITERAKVYGVWPAYSYVLQEGPTPPKADSIRPLSSTLTLHQGEPTDITVINAARHTTTIHWHGIELESIYDGVGGWSGWGKRVAPAVAPGDSFVVRLTPPRAGTFMYHTHVSEGVTLASGLYGALLVLPSNAPPDSTEHTFVIGMGGPLDDAPAVVNGSASPSPIALRAGVAHRFRFINVSPLETRTVELKSGSALARWRPLAKDGADLPAHQATPGPATVLVHPGETYDFEVMAVGGDSLVLSFVGPPDTRTRLAALRTSPPTRPPRLTTAISLVVRE